MLNYERDREASQQTNTVFLATFPFWQNWLNTEKSVSSVHYRDIPLLANLDNKDAQNISEREKISEV